VEIMLESEHMLGFLLFDTLIKNNYEKNEYSIYKHNNLF